MSPSVITLGSPVTDLYGIGPEAGRKLQKLEINTVFDLLTFIPRRYNDWSAIGKIEESEDGKELSFLAQVTSNPVKKGIKKQAPVSFYVSDGTGRIELSYFNAPYILNKFVVGDKVFVHGQVSYYGMHPQIVNPFCERADSTDDLNLVRPVYHLTSGITSNMINKWARYALKAVKDTIPDIIPESLRIKEHLCSASEAYEYVHMPSSLEQAAEGRRRIAYEELILLGIGMKHFMSAGGKDEIAPVVIPSGKLSEDAALRWKTVVSNLGLKLTGAQKKAIADIQHDLMKDTPMNRLVQGDVGSGKTAVAILSMAMTAIMGKQAVLLAPTSVLAKQHYDSATALLKGSGINVALLLGKTKASLKKEIKEQLREGEASIIIGTHAVLTDDVKFNELSLVIADEQHRFGVKQREKLLISRDGSDGINSVHNLVMTATPIPRPLAMVIYGDMATSVIREKPAGRKEIKTHFLPYTDGDDIYNVLLAKLKRGEQAYIVCPRIDDDSENLAPDEFYFDDYSFLADDKNPEAVSVKEMKKRLDARGISDKYPTEILYGSMKETNKLDVMERFLNNEVKVLISTTVIEVGVNNPNATMMIIMNAERFGLSTLHQLRGRIGRGDKQSYCVLCSDNKTERALERMKLMCECSDGFELAGKDLELRGPGDFFGTRQHGIPTLRAANLFTDAPLAKTSCDEVNKVFEKGGEDAARLMDNIGRMFRLRFADKMGTL